jgi:hypothetical protein
MMTRFPWTSFSAARYFFFTSLLAFGGDSIITTEIKDLSISGGCCVVQKLIDKQQQSYEPTVQDWAAVGWLIFTRWLGTEEGLMVEQCGNHNKINHTASLK